MRWRRREPAPEEEVVDIRERLAPYERSTPDPSWRATLMEADRKKRRDRPLRATPVRPRHLSTKAKKGR